MSNVVGPSKARLLWRPRQWSTGLSKDPARAKAFYAAIAVATLLGALANVLKISPIKALIWAAALNAIVAVPVMILIMRIAGSREIMGKFRVTGAWVFIGWSATAVMALASLAFLLSLVIQR